jgi:hypothetical protein
MSALLGGYGLCKDRNLWAEKRFPGLVKHPIVSPEASDN